MEISLQAVATMLRQAKSFVITGHVHPDGDSLGSMLALHEYLVRAGKVSCLLLDDDIPKSYDFLPGIKQIRRPGKLPVIADLLIVLDASDADRVAGVSAMVNARMLNIDHHISNTFFADYLYMDEKAAATGEIVLSLLHILNAPISTTQAINLYTAIATDCGFFRYANTTSATLRYAAELIEAGAQPHIISEQLETKPLKSVMILKSILETLEIHHNGEVASITLSPSLLGDSGADSTEGLINYPRNIEGVEIAIMFNIIDDNNTRVSFRSRRADVSRLALSFGGGGHAKASGCTISGNFYMTKQKVLHGAAEILNEAGL